MGVDDIKRVEDNVNIVRMAGCMKVLSSIIGTDRFFAVFKARAKFLSHH